MFRTQSSVRSALCKFSVASAASLLLLSGDVMAQDGAGHDHAAMLAEQAQAESQEQSGHSQMNREGMNRGQMAGGMRNRQGGGHGDGMDGGHDGGMGGGQGGGMEMMAERHASMHQEMGVTPENGQSAFNVIQSVVQQLEQNPDTDWSTVNMDALRDHLIDMQRVMIGANVSSENIEGGVRHTVSGNAAPVQHAIHRMVLSHARQMSSSSEWTIDAERTNEGAVLTITSDVAAETVKIRALGFSGFMVLGDHHQAHHWQMATGQSQAQSQSHQHEH